jgi:uncharacterized protein (TIGR03000 family)
MIRTVFPLAAVLLIGTAASAQPAIHNGHGGHTSWQPAGVITAPSLPIPVGQVGGVPGAIVNRPFPRRFRPGNALFGSYGYYPAYDWAGPDYYDAEAAYPALAWPPQFSPTTYVTPTYTPPAPTVPAERPARLQLTVPLRARVWLAGKEVDAKASPLELQSPPLEPGQTYTFDVKVTWPAGDKTEERTRTVSVEAGERMSLKYFQ